ncbi:MAG: PilZ domain-containing protein [Terriglobales bacterium]
MGTQPSAVHPRFAVAITVTVSESSGSATPAQLKNISLSGCYVETPREIKENTRVRVVLQTANMNADVWGVVKRRDTQGLGIRFTNGAAVEDWKRLEALIDDLQASAPARAASAAASK